MSILLDTGWGISILTFFACALVVAAFTLGVTAVLALLVYAVKPSPAPVDTTFPATFTPFPRMATSCERGEGLAMTIVTLPALALSVLLSNLSAPLASAWRSSVVALPAANVPVVPAVDAAELVPVLDPSLPPPHPAG